MKPNFEMIRFTDEMMHIAEDYLRSNKGFLRVTVPRIVPVSGRVKMLIRYLRSR